MSLTQRIVAGLFAIVLMGAAMGYNADEQGIASVAALIFAILLILWALRPSEEL